MHGADFVFLKWYNEKKFMGRGTVIGTLFISLLDRLGLIVIFAFIISKTGIFKNYIIREKTSLMTNLFFAFLWGAMGILMTFLGTPVAGGIANSRTIPVVLAGLLGGPVVGGISGMIAGVHRAFFTAGGDLTAYSCALSTVLGGLIGGFAKKKVDQSAKRWMGGFVLGLVVECVQMVVLLVSIHPFSKAIDIVKWIFIPMTFLNSLGIGIFLLIVEQIYNENDAAAAQKAQMAFDIANRTFPYFKKGLTIDSAMAACKIIADITAYKAVSITNETQVLAFVGKEIKESFTGMKIQTEVTQKCLRTGYVQVDQKCVDMKKSENGSKLRSVVVAPLKINERVVGCIKVYRERENAISQSDQELIKGLATLLTTQLELSNVEKQKILREAAELKALRAQIKPHFLFNSLNTIMSLIRTDATEARALLQELSVTLRSGFKDGDTLVPLKDEIRLVEAFLRIEKARFPEKLFVDLDLPDNLDIFVPPLILQPLVENAVQHGIRNKVGPGTVSVRIHKDRNALRFEVEDNGVGMSQEKLENLSGTEGIGLSNVRERLFSLYEAPIIIKSELGKGTKIDFSIPC